MRCSLMQTNHQTQFYPAEPSKPDRKCSPRQGRTPWQEGGGEVRRRLEGAVAHSTADVAFGAGDVVLM